MTDGTLLEWHDNGLVYRAEWDEWRLGVWRVPGVVPEKTEWCWMLSRSTDPDQAAEALGWESAPDAAMRAAEAHLLEGDLLTGHERAKLVRAATAAVWNAFDEKHGRFVDEWNRDFMPEDE
ncbi:hypothetical protein [Azospirillum tabaci]|uniref:hypothetical protein n=1 Tax=Azospirillum tabaci TaxID=2752310 RepID=UPI001661852B|nr:hypothetical protein [Azospirillum tabaci]